MELRRGRCCGSRFSSSWPAMCPLHAHSNADCPKSMAIAAEHPQGWGSDSALTSAQVAAARRRAAGALLRGFKASVAGCWAGQQRFLLQCCSHAKLCLRPSLACSTKRAPMWDRYIVRTSGTPCHALGGTTGWVGAATQLLRRMWWQHLCRDGDSLRNTARGAP